MKKTLFAIGLLVLTSCSITEKLVVLPDDQVKISHEIDFSQMLVMAKSMGGNESKDIAKQKKDTLISFKSIFEKAKDSIALLPVEEQKKLKAIEKYNMKMVMNEDEGQFMMTLFADFDNIKELGQVMDFAEILDKSNVNPTGGKDLPNNLLQTPGKTTFTFADNTFKRKTVFEKPEKVAVDQEAFDSENPDPAQMFEMVKEMPVEMKYKIAYRFPKRIRATNVKNAKISEDRLGVDFEFDLKTYETDPEYLNLEIYFE